MKKKIMFAAIAAVAMVAQAAARPAPSPALKARLEKGPEVIGIVHWGLNTYTDREWGFGNENPALLNPANFDADQIVQACKAGGIGGLVIVAKHHDGFCLWPTKTTGHNITKSPFRGGRGDYVREMERACRKAGLKFGVYVSPWDRNSAHYATEKYVEIFNAQPRITVFGGGNHGDFRWPGNERGLLDGDSRATIVAPDDPAYRGLLNVGTPDGVCFRACESDFPQRNGWFYHERERGTTKSAAYLMKLYLSSVGNAGTMDIGVAPNKAGVLDDADVKSLAGFGAIRQAFFSKEVSPESGEPFNVVVMREDISCGEQVDGWEFSSYGQTLFRGKSIGVKRIRVLESPVAAKGCDLKVVASGENLKGVSFKLYYADPELVRMVLAATTDSGETDTAKWMTLANPLAPKE